jgi:hypothetical protein
MIIGLDLATRLGWCIGAPGTVPRSGSFRLKMPSEPIDTALLNLFRFLEREFNEKIPSLVIAEKKLSIAAQLKLTNNEANIDFQCSLHAVTRLICRLFGVPCISVADSTIRKHLLGRGKLGDRKSTKAAVVARCKLIGLIERTAPDDDDRSDAVAAWEYACAHHARRSPAELFMFGEATV